MKIIPIVMATDDKYAPYCYVAITSIMKHADKKNSYRIFVFNTMLSNDSICLLEELTSEYISVSCINVRDVVDTGFFKSTKYLSIETYYRLYIPVVLKEFEKVLYLDSDICLMSDVAELYNSDLQGKAVGAVRDVHTANIEAHSQDLGIEDYKETFNAGILLVDNAKFEADHIREKCLDLLMEDNRRAGRKFIWADQDALNIVLYKKVTFLDDVWNCQVQYLIRPQVIYEEYRERYADNINNAKIIHFAGGDKLWFYPKYKQARVFWEYAKDTPVFNELLVRSFEKAKVTTFERYHFPYDLIPYRDRIVIYGAGKAGQMLYQQMKLTEYAKVVLWVDKNWDQIDKSLSVLSPETINQCDYDHILLAIDRKEIADKAKKDLEMYGVHPDSIIWTSYGSLV